MGLKEFQESAAQAAALVRSRPAGTRWFLACDTDADGLCAAAVAAAALGKVGHRFTVRASRDKTADGLRAALAEDPDAAVLLLDKGTSHLTLLANLAAARARPIVVVDHHALPEEAAPSPAVTLLNPRAEGLDGSRDASAATTALALALALCGDAALAWTATALAGACGDRQDKGGWVGWNAAAAQRARKGGVLPTVLRPRLAGDLASALARHEPAIPGLAGDRDAASALLERIGVARRGFVDDLPEEARTRLVSDLLLRLLAGGQAPADPRAALLEETDLHPALGLPVRQVARVADACGRDGQAGTAVAWLMGDKAARADALACLARATAAEEAALSALEESPPVQRGPLRVAWTSSPAFTGPVAEAAAEMVSAPAVVLAQRPDGLVQASARLGGARKLDLGRAMRAAAQAGGGEGGGHPEAAGAVLRDAEGFLAALESELADQGAAA